MSKLFKISLGIQTSGTKKRVEGGLRGLKIEDLRSKLRRTDPPFGGELSEANLRSPKVIF
jgi:hypothetical protein